MELYFECADNINSWIDERRGTQDLHESEGERQWYVIQSFYMKSFIAKRVSAILTSLNKGTLV